jgi:Flp pilus assembly protein TadG
MIRPDHTRRRGRRHDDEAGNATIEMAVLAPVVVLVGIGIFVFGSVAGAQGAVQDAANAAARAASLSRSGDVADAQARSTADSTLANSDVSCSSTTVTSDLTAFTIPPGQVEQVTASPVTVTVTCVVPLARFGIPAVPGQITITRTGASVIDAYRGRT